MSDFKNLKVWQEAQELMLDARKAAIDISGADDRNLRGQLIRAAESVPTNIVEGSVQQSRKQFARFLMISVGSASELEHHVITAPRPTSHSQSDFSKTDQSNSRSSKNAVRSHSIPPRPAKRQRGSKLATVI